MSQRCGELTRYPPRWLAMDVRELRQKAMHYRRVAPRHSYVAHREAPHFSSHALRKRGPRDGMRSVAGRQTFHCRPV